MFVDVLEVHGVLVSGRSGSTSSKTSKNPQQASDADGAESRSRPPGRRRRLLAKQPVEEYGEGLTQPGNEPSLPSFVSPLSGKRHAIDR